MLSSINRKMSVIDRKNSLHRFSLGEMHYRGIGEVKTLIGITMKNASDAIGIIDGQLKNPKLASTNPSQ
jgi:hypothetical protein